MKILTRKGLIKKHSYKDSNFEIKVNLNFKIEKRLGGKREHLVTVYSTESPIYNAHHLAETQNLEEIINIMVHDAEKWVDNQFNKEKTPEEILLFNLGFDKEE